MKMKKAISLILVLCLALALCCSTAFAAYYSDVINLRPDYKGVTEGVLKGTDYLRNTHIPDSDLDSDYQPWMQAAVGDHFTEEYFHQYQVYYKCVLAGVINEGDDLDLSLVIKSGESSNVPAAPVKELVGMTSSLIAVPENYAGRTEGIVSAADVEWNDDLGLDDPYEIWMKMEYGSDFTEGALHEYQLYWKTVEAGYVEAGEDMDLSLILDTEVYSDGSTVLVSDALLDAKYQAMRVPSIIICAVLMVVILAATIVWLFLDSNKRYKAYLARGGAAAEPKEEVSGPVLNRKQVVELNLFGNVVFAVVLRDEDATAFSFAYELNGRKINAFGEIRDGQYVVTEDPAGVGKMVVKDIVSKLTDEWE